MGEIILRAMCCVQRLCWHAPENAERVHHVLRESERHAFRSFELEAVIEQTVEVDMHTITVHHVNEDVLAAENEGRQERASDRE